MDPLSITASIVTFIDVAKRIKDSVDKIGQNRQTLKELMNDVLDELTELRKLCQHREGELARARLDYDAVHSLEGLESDLNKVLQQILERRKRNRLSSLKAYVAVWAKNTEIEAHILRLKDRVSSVHRRFTYIASLRMEHGLLVVTTEHRMRMARMEGLVSQLLIDSDASGAAPASVLDHASPDGVEFQFLRLQVRKIVDRLSHISATHAFIEEPLSAQPCMSYSQVSDPEPMSSLMRSAMITFLQILQLLEQPSDFTFLEGVEYAFKAYSLLLDVGLVEEAAAVTTWAVALYRRLTQNDATYMTYVVAGLMNLADIRTGTPEGMDAAKSALTACRSTVATPQEDSSSLAHCLRSYTFYLIRYGEFDTALEYAKEALAIQRDFPDHRVDGDTLVVWEASGERDLVYSSARSITRSFQLAAEEGFSLYLLAISLGCESRYTEAAIVGVEAINCLTALGELGYSSVERPPAPIEQPVPADDVPSTTVDDKVVTEVVGPSTNECSPGPRHTSRQAPAVTLLGDNLSQSQLASSSSVFLVCEGAPSAGTANSPLREVTVSSAGTEDSLRYDSSG
ncbi:hypothetical protein EYR38_002240 [Pleurotus pulmonarius]|nr:hypothetical protein EYR38_002240 [Pleurotus pulmonarius]